MPGQRQPVQIKCASIDSGILVDIRCPIDCASTDGNLCNRTCWHAGTSSACLRTSPRSRGAWSRRAASQVGRGPCWGEAGQKTALAAQAPRPSWTEGDKGASGGRRRSRTPAGSAVVRTWGVLLLVDGVGGGAPVPLGRPRPRARAPRVPHAPLTPPAPQLAAVGPARRGVQCGGTTPHAEVAVPSSVERPRATGGIAQPWTKPGGKGGEGSEWRGMQGLGCERLAPASDPTNHEPRSPSSASLRGT